MSLPPVLCHGLFCFSLAGVDRHRRALEHRPIRMRERDNIKSDRMEDYLLAILELSRYSERIRSKEVADRMGVTQPTVVTMFKRLDRENLVRFRKYEGVVLLRRGRNTAHAAHLRLEILERFFVTLGMEQDIARRCAKCVRGELPPECMLRVDELTAFLMEEDVKREWKKRLRESFGK